uniref:Uncharacterized protein n=1 Tax=Anguilla anguilla TaxID=7936 RepID=A0A0E9QHA2_ANGAN
MERSPHPTTTLFTIIDLSRKCDCLLH